MNKSNVIMFENGMQNNFAVKTRNVLNEKQRQLTQVQKRILSKWSEYGFPIPYPVMNNKTNTLATWQTYYKEFGKTSDDGKVRIGSKDLDRLYQKMQIVINKIDKGVLQVANTNATIVPLLNEYNAYLRKMVDKGNMSPQSFETKTTYKDRLVAVISTNKHLIQTKVNRWTASEIKMLYELFADFTKSNNTKKLWLNLLKDTFDMAILFKKIPKEIGNVVSEWMNFAPNKKDLRTNADSYHAELENQIMKWDFDMMKNFLSSIDDKRFALAMKVGVYAGLRVAEIFGLEFADFRVKSNMVRVSGQSSPVARNKKAVTKTAKGMNRLVPLPPTLYKECLDYINRELSNPYAVSDRIMFPNCHKGVWDWHNSSSSRTALDNVLVGQFAMPPKVRFHFFRHWIITQWIRHDIHQLYQVSYFAGHKDMSITARKYNHVFQLADDKKCNKEEFLNGNLF